MRASCPCERLQQRHVLDDDPSGPCLSEKTTMHRHWESDREREWPGRWPMLRGERLLDRRCFGMCHPASRMSGQTCPPSARKSRILPRACLGAGPWDSGPGVSDIPGSSAATQRVRWAQRGPMCVEWGLPAPWERKRGRLERRGGLA